MIQSERKIRDGRTPIDMFDHGGKMRTRTFSKRAFGGKLEVVKKSKGYCPICGHHKILINTKIEKCARCKHEMRRY